MEHLSGFKSFLEEEKPKADFFASLGDEENINWENIKKIFEDEPWISAHFGLGAPGKEILYKLSPWEIVKGSLTPQGADIRLKTQKNNRSYLSGDRLNKSDYRDNRRYHLNRKELLKFLTTGWSPAVQAAGGGGGDMGMGGPPIS
jgi:hypothetical protein